MAGTESTPGRDPRHATDGNAEHEGLCTQCGKCCYKKIIVGNLIVITPFPCEFLDTATNLCTVYEERFEKNPYCLNIEQGMNASAFPPDCGYVPVMAPPGYQPALEAWSWKHQWRQFDGIADDLEVSTATREKIRARGPEAPPLYVETNERLKQEKERKEREAALWGPHAGTVDLNKVPAAPPEAVPKLSDMLKGNPQA